jgi:hypothetical protein
MNQVVSESSLREGVILLSAHCDSLIQMLSPPVVMHEQEAIYSNEIVT